MTFWQERRIEWNSESLTGKLELMGFYFCIVLSIGFLLLLVAGAGYGSYLLLERLKP